MFFSIDLNKRCGLPLVAHASWDDTTDLKKHNTILWIFSSQEHVYAADEEIKEGGHELQKLISTLPPIVSEKPVIVRGDAAASLAASVSFIANNAAHLNTPGNEPHLAALWTPPWGNSNGIIIWRSFDLQYNVAIVWTKAQALSILDEFTWMNSEVLQRRRELVTAWDLADDSEKPIQRITGKAAHLLYMASLFRRIQSAVSRKMN